MKKYLMVLCMSLGMANSANATEWVLSEYPSIAGAIAILSPGDYSITVNSEQTFRITGYADVDCNDHNWELIYSFAGKNDLGQQVLNVDVVEKEATVMACPSTSIKTVRILPKWNKVRDGETVELVIPGWLSIEFK